MIELQILDKAEQMFKLLKNYEWQKKDQMILFMKMLRSKFNGLYQDVLKAKCKN